MAEHLPSPDSTTDLQFTSAERAETGSAAATSGLTCLACGRPIAETYFAIADKVICPACRAQVNAPPKGNKVTRFLAASVLGLGAGLIGALIWFVVRRAASVEVGIIAVLVGFLVGKAVRMGSGNRGGLAYQILAVLLTYICIAANYVPDVVEAVFKDAREQRAAMDAAKPDAAAKALVDPAEGDAAGRADVDPAKSTKPKPGTGETIVGMTLLLVFALGFALALPFLQGLQNLIGLLIIGIALWEAWKFNAARKLPITGPYRVGAQQAV